MNTTEVKKTELTPAAGAYIVFLCMLFGANSVAIKLAFTGLGQFTSIGLRFTLASVAICLWARFTGRSFRLTKGQLPHLLMLSLVYVLQLSLFYMGLGRTYASRCALITNLLPFFVLFLSHFLIPGEGMTRRKLLGLILGFVGICFVFVEPSGLTGDIRAGDFMILGGVVFWAINVVYTKKVIDRYQPFHLVIYTMLFTMPVFYAQAFLFDPVMVIRVDNTVVTAMLYQGFVTAGFGFVSWNGLLKRYGATTLHSFVFLMPLSGVLFSGLLLHEPITAHIIMATLFIAAGIVVVHLRPRQAVSTFPLGRGL